MKKLSRISDQIKNNTYSYTGKGSFESIVNDNKDDIINWLEELIPLQKQMNFLNDKANVNFQKRNYTRILTKICPNEYKEFVSLNILIRDASLITQFYENNIELNNIYNNLIQNKHLKYPGKYNIYVDFEIFEKFVFVYKEELDLDIKPNKVKEIIDDKNELNIIKSKENPIKKETNWTNLLLGKK